MTPIDDRFIVRRLKRSLNSLGEVYRPFFAALIGSRASGHAHPQSDLDLLVVLNAADGDFFKSSGKCESLERAIKKFQKPDELGVVCVPSFALMEHSLELARRRRRGNLLTFHLLVYPTFQYLFEWETPEIIRGYLNALNPQAIIVGSHSQVPRLKGRKMLNFPVIHSRLLERFQASYVYYLNIKDDDIDFALHYGFKHLRYSIKHLAAAVLRESGIGQRTSGIAWEQVMQHCEVLPGVGCKLVRELDAIRPEPPRQPIKCCNPNTLHRLYREGWDFFRDCHPKCRMGMKRLKF
jgi:predicted nucleotidyltransferase